jgi:hypothetical protein
MKEKDQGRDRRILLESYLKNGIGTYGLDSFNFGYG